MQFIKTLFIKITDFSRIQSLKSNARFYFNIVICLSLIFVSETGCYETLLAKHEFEILQYEVNSPSQSTEINSERIGILLQIISCIMCSIVAFISVFITMQNNEFLGIHYVDIWKLRVNFHFCLKHYVVISILLLAANLFCYLKDLWSWCIGITASSLWFTLFFIINEFKYAELSEKDFIAILKNYLLLDFLRQNKYSKKGYEEIKDNIGSEALLKYLQKKELRVVLKKISISSYSKYNHFILSKLVTHIYEITNNLDKIQDPLLRCEQYKIIKNSLFYLFTEDDVVEIETKKIITNQIIFSFYKLLSIDEYKDEVSKQITEIFTTVEVNDSSKVRERVFNIVVELVINSIKNNNFDLLKIIKDDLTDFDGTCLRYNKTLKRFYMLISFFMYSLAINNTVTLNIKNSVNKFLHCKCDSIYCLSWQDLYKKFISNFDMSLDVFFNDVMKNKHLLEYFPINNQVITTNIEENIAITWYVSVFLNQTNYHRVLTEILPVKSQRIKPYINYFARKFIQQNKTSVNIDENSELFKIAKFLSGENHVFSIFSFKEYREKIRHYFNEIVINDNEQFENEVNKNKDNELQKLSESINTYLSNNFFIQEYTSNQQQLFQSQSIRKSFIAEYSCLHFYIDSISEYIVEQIKRYIDNHSLQVTESNFNFILNLLKEKLAQDKFKDQFYVLGDHYSSLLGSDNVEEYQKLDKMMQNLKQNQFKGSGLPIFVFNNGIKLNTRLNIETLPLQINEIENVVNKYESVDGFYSYKDALLSKDQLYEIISRNCVQFNIFFTFDCEIDKNSVISFYNFSNCSEPLVS